MELYEISFPIVVCFGAVVVVYVYLREKIERAERDLKEYRAALEDLQEQVKTMQSQFPTVNESMNDYLETTRHVSTLLVQLREELDDMKKEL